MLPQARKKGISVIIASMGKPKEGPSEEGKEKEYEESSEPENEEKLNMAAEEIISAVRTKDVFALVEALKYFVSSCKE